MEPVFNGDKMVLGPHEAKFDSVSMKVSGNRNRHMVETLLQPNINGVFLFYLDRNDVRAMNGFMMPPGLSAKDSAAFQKKFLELLEKYAKIANK